MLHYLRDVAPRVRLPRRQAELMERCRRACGTTGEAPAGPEAERRRREDLGVGEDQWGLFQRQRRLNGALPFEERPLQERELALPLSGNGGGHHPHEDGCGDGQEPPQPAEADVETLLAVLEARERLVVERVVLQGASYRKVGAELGISAMTVQRCLRRGLDRLRRSLPERRIRTATPCCPVASAAPGC
jgi:RNA polymerase sigma-B factor